MAKARLDAVKKRSSISEWVMNILLILFSTTAIAQPFVIPTGSMEDTLLVGDHLIVDKLAYGSSDSFTKHLLPYQEPKHGDVIVFRYPGNLSETYIKRLIGLPGDRLRIVANVLYRNGVALKEPYVYHKFAYDEVRDKFPGPCCLPVRDALGLQLQREMLTAHVKNGELIVPPGQYFAMGDNRDNSEDSRFWGFVPRENLVGKPVLIYWSYQASTEDLSGETAGSLVHHFFDVSTHFFTQTRWARTLRPVRGFPESQLP